MQFLPWKARAITALPIGTEFMTRRLCKEGDELWPDDIPYPVHPYFQVPQVRSRNGWLCWEVGRAYAIQPGRGKRAFCHAELTAIRREPLQEISDEDALLELIEQWPDLRPEEASDIAVNGHLANAWEPFARLWDTINKRKGTRWQDKPDVWVLTLRRA